MVQQSTSSDLNLLFPKKAIYPPVSDETSQLVTPDQLLLQWGASNFYLLSIWISMAIVWGLSAMPMMVSAFLMNDACVPSLNNSSPKCSSQNGSLAQEFGLTGHKAVMVEYTTSAFLFGVVIGSTFLPFLSDKKGRRLVLLSSMTVIGLTGCGSAFASGIYSFIVLRFMQGIFFTGCSVTNWILAYESIPIKLRSYTTLSFGLMWVVGYCAVGPLAYWLPNWRQLIFTTSAPMLLFALVYYLYIPESFHYLVSKGDHNKVTEWMQKANSSANQLGTPKVMDITATQLCNHSHAIKTKLLKDETSFPQTGLLQQLLSSKLLLLYTLVMLYLWTCDTFVYYGLSLHSTQISGNKFLNFAFMGLIEIPSYLISPFMLNRIGRRGFVSLCHFLAAASFFTILFTDDSRISLAMWLLGKFSISCAFTSLFVYASEVFPTVARNGCIGICSMVARIGGAFVPTVRTMSLISPMIPTVLFGVSAGIGGILTLILPETANEQLPNSIDQMTCRTVRKIKPEMC